MSPRTLLARLLSAMNRWPLTCKPSFVSFTSSQSPIGCSGSCASSIGKSATATLNAPFRSGRRRDQGQTPNGHAMPVIAPASSTAIDALISSWSIAVFLRSAEPEGFEDRDSEWIDFGNRPLDRIGRDKRVRFFRRRAAADQCKPDGFRHVGMLEIASEQAAAQVRRCPRLFCVLVRRSFQA